jgi:hypothetical protein
MNKFYNLEKRIKLFNFLRPWTNLSHPKLNLKTSKTRMDLLVTMRDLRNWVQENAPFGSRTLKHNIELEQIIKEIQYLETRRFFLCFIVSFGLCVLTYNLLPAHYFGQMDAYSKPL